MANNELLLPFRDRLRDHHNARKQIWMRAYCTHLTHRRFPEDAKVTADRALEHFDEKFPMPKQPMGCEW